MTPGFQTRIEHDVLGVSTNASWLLPINKAFVLRDKDIQGFYDTGKNWIVGNENGDPKIRCKVSLKDTKEAIVSDTVRSVVDYSNPRRKQITKITLEMVSQNENRSFRLEFQNEEWPSLISLIVGGENLTESEKVFRRTEAELYDLTQWYWFLSARKWLIILCRWMFWICLGIFMLFFVFAIILTIPDLFKSTEVQQTYKQHVATDSSEHEQVQKTPLIKKPLDEITHQDTAVWHDLWALISNRQFLIGVGFVLGVIGLERLMLYLFPKAIFDIGKGKERHAKIKKLRKWIGGIITAIIILCINKMIWGNAN